MQLLSLPKIPVGRADSSGADDWFATEKVHGAQLVVGVDAGEVSVGKRKAWLAADEAFFGWQMLRPQLHAAGRAIHTALGGLGETWIYGELFGGAYPHPDVTAVSGLVPVQTGIWYAPSLEYAVFDIAHCAPGGEPVFLAHQRVLELTETASLRTVPVLGRGGLSELQRMPIRFPTLMPTLLGLPKLEANYAEGYVLKPTTEAPFAARMAVKHKIPEFDEARFDDSRAFDPNAHLSLDELLALAARLMNPARLASARSKIGVDSRQVIEEATLDALIDLRDMFPRRIEALTPPEEHELFVRLEAKARELLAGQG
jgi:Rnl2 family RNA ligase